MAMFREQIETVSAKLQTARTGILKRERLDKFISPEQAKSLALKFAGKGISKDEQILTWLGFFADISEEESERDQLSDIAMQWRNELVGGRRIDALTEADVQGVVDVWKLKLPERAALYKYWIKMYQNTLSNEKAKESRRYQTLASNMMSYSEHDLVHTRRKIEDMENKLYRCRLEILKEELLISYLPQHSRNLIHSLVQNCPRISSAVFACMDVWLCLDGGGQNEEILSAVMKKLDDDFVDVEEEATAEDAERRLNDDDDDGEEYLARHSRRTNVQLVHDALGEMAFSTIGSKQESSAKDGQWQGIPMSKKKLAFEMRRLLNIENPMQDPEALQIYDVWTLQKEDRRRLYRYWMDSYIQELRSSIEDTEDEYENLCKSYKEAMDAEDVELMTGAEVIGMTTTGAAKYRTILQQIEPKIVIVEEAAEVLESHIVTTINSNCQHLILIGDHKQLRPTPTVYDLAMKYNLEISLFERMVQNELNFTTLRIQHRMRPQISILMRHIYSELEDHEAVLKYEHVKGVSKDVFMINHGEPETSHEETKSKSNLHEARFMSQLCRYLLQQGYNPSQITVLTTYTGQVLAIRKCMPKRDFEGIKITAVDNFQGEENDIILLSLVRSNSEDNIGFLKIENRICVALSRARMGFFIIGNFTLLTKVSPLWENMVQSMAQQNCFGCHLTLLCQNHPDQETQVAKSEDFMSVPNGGCKLMCNTRLPCGHVCEQICHPEDREHKYYRCFKPCERTVCDLGHKCLKKCFDECGSCLTKVTKTVPFCGHQHMMPCHKTPSSFTCISPCIVPLDCGHKCQGTCGMCRKNGVHFICKEKCIRLLPCGHKIEAECSMPVEKIECKADCNTKLTCGHDCIGTCHTCLRGKLHIPCQKKCGRPLICGHTCNQTCSEPCPPCKKKCTLRCYHSLCQNKCGEVCIKCEEPCNWACEHQKCNMKCNESCNRPPCFMPCPKKLSCGCPCRGFCGEVCPDLCKKCKSKEFLEVISHVINKQNARLVVLEDCKHIFEASFLDEYMSPEGTPESTSAPVEKKKCPKCSVLISRSRRYRNNLKQISNDVDKVKERLDGDRRTNNRRKALALKEIEMFRQIDEDAADFLLKKPEIKEKDKPMSTQSLDLLENQLEIFKCLHEVSSFLRSHPVQQMLLQDITKSLAHVKTWVMREYFLPSKKEHLKTRWRQSFTKQELEEVKQEMARMSYIVRFSSVAKDTTILPGLLASCIQEVQKLLNRTLNFTGAHEEKVRNVWELVIETLPDYSRPGISKPQLIAPKGMTENGRWYRCTKGHINQVEGEKQKCRECHLQVGPGCYTPRVTYPPAPADLLSLEVEDCTDDTVSSPKPVHVKQLVSRRSEKLERDLVPALGGIRHTLLEETDTRSQNIATLQPGVIKSNSYGKGSSALRDGLGPHGHTTEDTSSNGKRYLFKCSNGHLRVFRISDVPHKCPDCESTLFTQQREILVETKGPKGEVDNTQTKEAKKLPTKQEKIKMIIKCKQGHELPKDATTCLICVTREESEPEHSGDSWSLSVDLEKAHHSEKTRVSSLPKQTISDTKKCPKGHRLLPNEKSCTLCDLLRDQYKLRYERAEETKRSSVKADRMEEDMDVDTEGEDSMLQLNISKTKYADDRMSYKTVSLTRDTVEDSSISGYDHREVSKADSFRDEGSKTQSSLKSVLGKWKEFDSHLMPKRGHPNYDAGESMRSRNVDDAGDPSLPRASERSQAVSRTTERLGEWRRVDDYKHKLQTHSVGDEETTIRDVYHARDVSVGSGIDCVGEQKETTRTPAAIRKCGKGHIMLRNEDQCSWCRERERSATSDVKFDSSPLPSSDRAVEVDKGSVSGSASSARYRSGPASADTYRMVGERLARSDTSAATKLQDVPVNAEAETDNPIRQVEKTDRMTSRDRDSSASLKTWFKSIWK